eukprot:7796249-Lingulodinium_polyedra.AAC.1
MEPPQFAESPALAALGGSLVRPVAPLGTCLSERGLRVYDFFIVHPALARFAEAGAPDVPPAPRAPM